MDIFSAEDATVEMVPKTFLRNTEQIPGVKRLPIAGTEGIMPGRIQTPMRIEPMGYIQMHMVLLIVIGLVAVVLHVAVSIEKSPGAVLTPVHLYILAGQTIPCQIGLLFAAEGKQVNRSLAVLPT